jgi:phenylpropionate dioxygenase-like ring-hydroxylating dioxygenase large terminal subunit
VTFPLNQWYVGAFSWEVKNQPLGRTLLNQPVVLFRDGTGQVFALEDRCCHRALPLSRGAVEAGGLRCGYHGLLYDGYGRCVEIPGQERISERARVAAYMVREQDQIIWIWFGAENKVQPTHEPPSYTIHGDARYEFKGDIYHYDAPWQLVHDNLLDLSHLGYVHLKTIGGNARLHMNAETRVESEGDSVRVLRFMPNSVPPPTYTAAWPLKDKVDRWQEIEFFPNHLRIWTGAVNAGTDALTDPNRGGFHMRGLHCITPETDASCHYLWTMATNRTTDAASIMDEVYRQTTVTFDEDKVVIEAQYANMQRFGERPMISIHVDAAPVRARRIIDRLMAAT